SALAVRTLARKSRELDGARVEPWVSPYGIGLLSHGPRQSPTESTAQHAARIASALGRALAGSEILDDDAAEARASMQAELDPETQPLWPIALEALSPKHPSLLDPRGTWQSITELSTQAAEVERRALVRGPLRLAVLANASYSRPDPAALE